MTEVFFTIEESIAAQQLALAYSEKILELALRMANIQPLSEPKARRVEPSFSRGYPNKIEETVAVIPDEGISLKEMAIKLSVKEESVRSRLATATAHGRVEKRDGLYFRL